jgi:hypothetical protein
MTDPTPAQLAQLDQWYASNKATLDGLIGVHRCDVLNKAGRIPETMRLGGKLSDFGTPEALGFLLAVAIDMLAEKTQVPA